MKRHFVAGALLVMCVQPAPAQSKPAESFSGTWSGYLGRTASQPASVKMVFKLAPDGSLTGSAAGPQLSPGEIKTGSYDKATGVIKFTVELHDTENNHGGMVRFDGKVAPDPAEKNALTASGRMFLGGDTGVFKVVRESAETANSALTAKNAGTASGVLEVRRGFAQVSDWITRAADLVPADKYSYRPVATVRTFAEVVGHVIDGSHYYCGRGAGKSVQWTTDAEKGMTTKAALVAGLKQAMSECAAAYEGATQLGPLMENVAHDNLHYGNMITYMRMLGLVPPSS